MKTRKSTTGVIDPVKVVCYGEETLWENRADAIAFFFKGMIECFGAERDRYTNIYIDLMEGCQVCVDEWD